MPIVRQLCGYCWISLFFLLPICTSDKAKNIYETKQVFRDVIYTFSETQDTWTQARRACEENSGALALVEDSETKDFLKKLSADLSGPAWWVGGGSHEIPSQSHNTGLSISEPVGANGASPRTCTYLNMEPFQLVTTPNCNMTLGYLCALGQTRKTRGVRVRRSPQTDLQTKITAMSSAAALNSVLNKSIEIIQFLELEDVSISYDQKLTYLSTILSSYQKAKSSNTDIVTKNLTTSCTNAIILHALQMCNSDETPANLESLLFEAAKIYSEVSAATFVMELISGTLYATKVNDPQSLENMTIGGSSGSSGFIQMPPFSAMKSQLSNTPVNVQLFSFKANPLNSTTNQSITGAVFSLSLSSSASDVKFKNLSSLIQIYLPRPDAVEPTGANMSVKSGFSLITSFNVTDVNATVIISAEPNRENVSLRFILSPTYQSNNKSLSITVSKKDNYRWLIQPEMLRSSNGTWFVNITPINYTSSEPLQIVLTTSSFKCVYWDNDLSDWSRDGCWVGPQTTANMTHCMCNHNTFYGSSFFVMPNKVDLTRTVALFATVKENYVVVVVLSCFFFVYLLVALWAWYADRRALRTRKITLLEDNHPCAHYNYLLNLQTGNRKGAGTSAKVMMTLEGSNGESETHHLSDPDQPVFEKGGVDMFMLSTPNPLGELLSIKLWHDNTGGHPDWFLQKVTVKDCQTKQIWHFFCNSWLTSSGDVPCKRTFNPAKKNEVSSFGNLFHARTSTGFRDEHIWMSIVDPPRHSPFTRVQRVSCCMCLLLCTMAINIMFWNIPNDGTSPVIVKLGTFELTWHQIMVAVESALLMFPINILIVTIFRSITPRIPNKEKFKSETSSQPPVASMQSVLKDSHDIVNHLSKCPKNQVTPMQQSPETTSDLFSALNQMHDFVSLMQAQTDGDQHWAHCSRFVYYSLCHLSMMFERGGDKIFPHPEDVELAKNTVNMMLKKTEMVTNSNPIQIDAPPPEEQKKKKPTCKLPWWFVFVGWALLVTISGICTFFTLLYGFQYGKESSIRWVITLTLSLFQSIFIIQPLKIVGLAIFFALVLRPVSIDDSEEVEILLEEQKEKCETFTGREMH